MKWYGYLKVCLILSCFANTVCAKSPAKRVIVVGGITDIGRELAKQYLQKGYTVGFIDDNKAQLEAFQTLENGALTVAPINFLDPEQARVQFQQFIETMGGMDICIFALSVAPEISQYGLLKDGDIPWNHSRQTILINILITAAFINVALNYFIDKGSGHLVGVSSLDALNGHPGCPAYTASKAFMANYLSGMRKKMSLLRFHEIFITDLRWSFIQDAKHSLAIGWIQTPQEAALHMIEAIEQRKSVAYIMSRWSFILWGLLTVPGLVKDMVSGISVLKRVE